MDSNEDKDRRRNGAVGTENDDQTVRTEASQSKTLAAGLAAGGAILVGCLIAGLVSFGGSSSKKTMKAPGRNHRIFRDDFEGDSKGYFRDLHKRNG
ncbi:hypothetical protein QQP08_007120 [Theobroma cacao]|nr:hypothetical protein QQP08_007120 [Theobroma cacao]